MKRLLWLSLAALLGAGAWTLYERWTVERDVPLTEWAGDDDASSRSVPAEPLKPETGQHEVATPSASHPSAPPAPGEPTPAVAELPPEPMRVVMTSAPTPKPLESGTPVPQEDLRKQAANAEKSFSEAYARLVSRQNRKEP